MERKHLRHLVSGPPSRPAEAERLRVTPEAVKAMGVVKTFDKNAPTWRTGEDRSIERKIRLKAFEESAKAAVIAGYRAGMSLRQIATSMNDDGFRNHLGHFHNTHSVRNILVKAGVIRVWEDDEA